MAFDPFKDFEEKGYLRNTFEFKDAEEVREMEHEVFRAGMDDAIDYLTRQENITYNDFLKVHKILFEDFYPWAGSDRLAIAPDYAISKAGIYFCHPQEIERAVNQGLMLARDEEELRKKPGEVMGYFAYGHPFLDGNGRTMLLIHSELCHRAGFSIKWHETTKNDYLAALTKEIQSPCRGHLDNYLKNFMVNASRRGDLADVIGSISGLDGSGNDDVVVGAYSEESVMREYREFEQNRNKGIDS